MGTVRKQLPFSLCLLTLKLAIVFLSMSSSFSTDAMEMTSFNKFQREPITDSRPPPHPLDGNGNALLEEQLTSVPSRHGNGPAPPPPPPPPPPLQETNDVYPQFMRQKDNAYGLLNTQSPPVEKTKDQISNYQPLPQVKEEKKTNSYQPPGRVGEEKFEQEFRLTPSQKDNAWNMYQEQKMEKKQPKGVNKCKYHTINFEEAPETFATENSDTTFQTFENDVEEEELSNVDTNFGNENPQSSVWQGMSDTRRPENQKFFSNSLTSQKNDEDP